MSGSSVGRGFPLLVYRIDKSLACLHNGCMSGEPFETDADDFTFLVPPSRVEEPLPAVPSPLDSPPVEVAGELLPAAVDEELPPWLQYTPPRDVNGRILVDAIAEARAGLRFPSFGDRLRRNGIAEEALKALVEIMQNPNASFKTRLDASIRILEFAHGTPMGQTRDQQVNVFLNVDI